mmetsp:Transcript_24481/g.61982  ORF Transcript_24481/g.61982 Transcript_24481/m.61982 type:complete len:84 (-) Transcript_24481:14-265(-)
MSISSSSDLLPLLTIFLPFPTMLTVSGGCKRGKEKKKGETRSDSVETPFLTSVRRPHIEAAASVRSTRPHPHSAKQGVGRVER